MKFLNHLNEGDTSDYLKLMVNFRKAHKPEDFKYSCLEEFILSNGKAMGDRSIESDKYKKGTMKECFKNAYRLASSKGFKYCEGYATSIIPTLHAWCLDEKGNVIDVTWKNGRDYFGVIFPMSYIHKVHAARGKYGVMDNYEQGFPLLKGEKFK